MTRDPEITAIYEAPLSPEEFERRLREALDSLEGEEGKQLAELDRLVSEALPGSKRTSRILSLADERAQGRRALT